MRRHALFVVLLLPCLPVAGIAAPYSIVDIGNLFGSPDSTASAIGYGINASSQVVGGSRTRDSETGLHPFLWTRGNMIDLGILPPPPAGGGSLPEGSALAINAAGEVVGTYHKPGFSAYHGFLWIDGVLTDLGESCTLGRGSINASGQMFCGGSGGINDAGHVATGHFFYLSWPSGGATDLGSLGNPNPAATGAQALNNSDVVTGFSSYDPGGGQAIPHAFRWESGTMTDLDPTSLHAESFADAINASGVIVGELDDPAPPLGGLVQHAMMTDATGMHDLNDLIPPGSGWVLEVAWGINDLGQIVGQGGNLAALGDTFLLEPCGNGVIFSLAGEQCDDGNQIDGDGCDSSCHLEPLTVSGTGTVATGTGTSAGAPAQAAVTSPSGGAITITRSADPLGGSGVSVLGTSFHITAPTESPTSPLVLVFDVDASVIPPDEDDTTIVVLKNGVAIPACTGPAGEASPDPCVTSRTALAGGGAEFTVLSSDASDWSFGVPLCKPTPQSGCKTPTAAAKSSLSLKTSGSVLTWKWGSGAFTTKSAFGMPTTGTDYALCLYDDVAGAPGLKATVGVAHGGTCGGRPCWKETNAGFSYGQKSASGALKLKLTQGLLPGKAKLQLSGKGSAVQLPTLPLAQDPAVRVQVVNGNGVCWEATYSSHTASDGATFKAKSD
jgi:cysteine-rich repeat protein/probable HAF family extracellular repeat protein